MNTNTIMNPRLEFQEKVYDALRANYPSIKKRLMFIFPPTGDMRMPVPPLQIIMENILALLKPTLLTVIEGNFAGSDLLSDMKTDYYLDLLSNQADMITYTLFCTISDTQISHLLYYVAKEYVFEFVKNSIIRPNLREVAKEVKDILTTPDVVGAEIKANTELVDKVESAISNLIIRLDNDAFMRDFTDILENKAPNKAAVTRDVIEKSEIFVPDFLEEILVNGRSDDLALTKLRKFFAEYIKTFSREGLISLFRLFSTNNARLESRIDRTIMERTSYLGFTDIPKPVDGLNIGENKVMFRVILPMREPDEHDYELIKNNPILSNAKAIVDKYRQYNDSVDIVNGDLIIIKSDGTRKLFNLLKVDIEKDINNPYLIFKKPDWVQAHFERCKDKSALYQTGMTKKEESDRMLGGQYPRLNSPEAKLQHRRSQITKLTHKLSKDLELMKELEVINNSRIVSPKYMNETANSTYIIDDEARLLLILAETEAVYKQILSDIAVFGKKETENEEEVNK